MIFDISLQQLYLFAVPLIYIFKTVANRLKSLKQKVKKKNSKITALVRSQSQYGISGI